MRSEETPDLMSAAREEEDSVGSEGAKTKSVEERERKGVGLV